MLGSRDQIFNIDFRVNMANSSVITKTKNIVVTDPVDPVESFLSAKDAAQLLRIKPQTLYAYVSRGWIHSIGHDKRRGYLYQRDDVERLRARGHARAEGGLYKAGTPRWSEPIVQTTITTITPAGPIYRGHTALELAQRGHSFESVAELLWSGVWMEHLEPWPHVAAPLAMDRLAKVAEVDTSQPDIVKLFSLLVASLAARPMGGDDLRDGNTIVAARSLLTVLPGCLGYLSGSRKFASQRTAGLLAGQTLADRILANSGAPMSREASQALTAALVLLADHELTPQTFAARLAASSGASLYFCVLSALSAHGGSRIRRACDKVEDLLVKTRTSGELRERFAEMDRSVEAVPGFNHPLYPNGDPRAEYLLLLARRLGSASRGGPSVNTRLEEAAEGIGARAGVEAGLVALCYALELPYRSAGAILTIARTAGWIAHVIEQRLAGMMLRPRARYRPS